jgi:hypothetical protein
MSSSFHSMDWVRPESDHSVSLWGKSLARRGSFTSWGTDWEALPARELSDGVVRLLGKDVNTKTTKTAQWAGDRVPYHLNSFIAPAFSLFDRWSPRSFPFNYIGPFTKISSYQMFSLTSDPARVKGKLSTHSGGNCPKVPVNSRCPREIWILKVCHLRLEVV